MSKKKNASKKVNKDKTQAAAANVSPTSTAKGANPKVVYVFMTSILLIVLASSVFFFYGRTGSAQASSPEMVKLEANQFSDGQARHFEYSTTNGINVRFFLVKDKNEKIRAALDACEVCWRAGRGYTQEGGVMICNNCGRRFPLERIGEERGGCNPHPLTIKHEGGQILIDSKELSDGQKYFDL